MKKITSDAVSDETFANFEIWRAKQDPPQSISKGLALLMKVFFDEHEKELKKYRTQGKDEKQKEGKSE